MVRTCASSCYHIYAGNVLVTLLSMMPFISWARSRLEGQQYTMQVHQLWPQSWTPDRSCKGEAQHG